MKTSITPNISDGVSIIIPTYKRPHGISTALPSAAKQNIDGYALEIIVADNDPAGSAKDYVAEFAAQSKANIIYVHVPEPGVANARNGAVAAASGRYIVFLDDDMEAERSDWASALVAASREFSAGLVFGPITATVPDPSDPHQEMMVPIYSRKVEQDDGYLEVAFGTGNSLIDRTISPLPSPVFNTALNEIGGEDDFLFHQLVEQGAKIAWASGAATFEHVPANRANNRYVWQRNFSWGQTPAKAAADRGVGGWPSVVFWMAVGCAQSVTYGFMTLLLRLTGQPKYVRYYARFAQGIGKILWADRLTPKLYGN